MINVKDNFLMRAKDVILLVIAVAGLIGGAIKLSAEPVLMKKEVQDLKSRVSSFEASDRAQDKEIALIKQQTDQIIKILERIDRRIERRSQ